MDIIDELIGGCDVGLIEGKEGAFVFLVADNEGNIGILTVLYEGVN